MEQKVWQAIRQYDLFSQGDDVIVALSGGADSVALFHFLHTHMEELGIRLSAAHFEHGIRGEESRQDAAFVQQLCGSYQVPLHMGQGHMDRRPRPQGMGTEEWARQLRYDFFDSLSLEQDAKIALAHTKSDQAETVVFNAIRGSGTKGLAGIPPRRGPYVRPFLFVQRSDVEAYCAANKLAFCQDKTNRDESYSRNRIRLSVMPQLEQAHPGAVQSLWRLAEDMRHLDSFLDDQARRLLSSAVGGGQRLEWFEQVAADTGFSAQVLLGAPQPVLTKALTILAGRSATRATIERVAQVLQGQLAAVQIPGGHTAHLKKGRLYIETLPPMPPQQKTSFSLGPGRFQFAGGYAIGVEIKSAAANDIPAKKNEENLLTFAADYDKIIKCSEFRTRRAADTYAPRGRGLTKPLRKWMNEQGLAPHLRPLLPLLAHQNTVYWVWDEGFCSGLGPDEDTKTLLVITQMPGGALDGACCQNGEGS